MSTKAKKSSAQSQASEPSKHAAWSPEEEQALISSLLAHQAKAGDGMNFRPAIWSAVAKEVGSAKGAAKTADSCKTKWGCIKEIFGIVDPLTNLSSIAWTPENGLGLTDDTPSDLKEVWKDYVTVCALKSFSIFANHVQKHPKASLYGEKGWSLYDNVKLLM
ncbi:hypothetical protein L208DRAFT_1296706, partial [Tricholoma matsutake]